MLNRKTILVLGAQGMLGRFTAERLKAAGHNVLRGGRQPEAVADFRLIDLDRIETFTAALEGVDLVVSSIEDPDTRAEREILRHGGLLISQATIPAAAQRKLHADSKHGAKGSVVLNSGLTGVVGLVIKDLLVAHPGADAIEIGFIASVLASMGNTGSKTAHAWFTSAPRLSETKLLFAVPRGLWPCFDMNHFDFLWLSETLRGKRKLQLYIGLAERAFGGLLKLLDWTGFLRFLPQAAFTGMVKFRPTPTALTEEPIRMRAAVYHQGKLLAACGLAAKGDYNSTTISTTLFAQALLDRIDNVPLPAGVCNVEEMFHFRDLEPELGRNCIVARALEY